MFEFNQYRNEDNNQLNFTPIDSTSEDTAQGDPRLRLALQAQIDYHRAREENETYVQKMLGFLPTGEDKTLHHLELLKDMDAKQPNMLSRETVVTAITDDQKALTWNELVTQGISAGAKYGLVFLLPGSSKIVGALGSIGLSALDSMHPKDSLAEQAFDGAFGATLGGGALYLGARLSPITDVVRLGASVTPVALSSMIGRHGLINKVSLSQPDPEKILNRPIPFTDQRSKALPPPYIKPVVSDFSLFGVPDKSQPQSQDSSAFPNAIYWQELSNGPVK